MSDPLTQGIAAVTRDDGPTAEALVSDLADAIEDFNRQAEGRDKEFKAVDRSDRSRLFRALFDLNAHISRLF